MNRRRFYLPAAFSITVASGYASAQPAAPAAPEPAPRADQTQGPETAEPAPSATPAPGSPTSEPGSEPATPPASGAEQGLAAPAPPSEPSEPARAETAPVAPLAPPTPPTLATPPTEPEASYPRFTPSLRLMVGFEREETTMLSVNAVTGALEQTNRQSYGFFLEQARVQLKGELTKRIDLEISAELSDGYEPAFDEIQYLRDAFINLRVKRYLQVRAGHFKRPLSALEHRSAGDLQVRGRGLTNNLIIDDNEWGGRALGMQLWGKLRSINTEWAIGAFNPAWGVDANRPEGVDVLGRLACEPVKGLTLAANGGTKTLEYAASEDYDTYYAGGGDVALELGGFSVLVDALYAQLPQSVGGENPKAMGVASVISYDVSITKKLDLQPVVFAEYSDSSLDQSNSETMRFVAGLNLLINKTMRIMPQVEMVRWLGDPSTFSPDESFSQYLMLSLAL